MKVKIGNYTSWFGPYQLAELLLFWIPKKKDEYGFPYTDERVHKFGEWLAHGKVLPEPKAGETVKLNPREDHTWLYKFLKWIDDKKKRKIEVRIDRWDTYSMDNTLAYIIHPMLVQLKATKQGAPLVEDADVPRHLRSKNARPLTEEEKRTHSPDEFHFQRWDWVLDEMIFAFESKLKPDWEEQFFKGESDLQWKKLEDGNFEMIRGPNDTHEYDEKGHRKYEKRIQNGFRLFGKYYQNLWD